MKPRLILFTGLCAALTYGMVMVALHRLPFPMFYVFSTPSHSVVVPSTPTLTIGWVGDMVPAESAEYSKRVFDGVANLLVKPDLMIGNLEGTFAQADHASKCVYLMSMCYAFRGDASFADSIKAAGFDMVSLTNNHAYDFGEEGLRDTEAELMRVDLPYITSLKPTKTIIVDGTHIGVLGLSSTEPWRTVSDLGYITKQVTKLKAVNNIVVVVFHGGAEGIDKTVVTGEIEYMGSEDRGNVEAAAYAAIDAGADLVLGSGPHVLRKVEWYKDRLIAYSLGNFVGGSRLSTRGILGTSALITISFKDNIPVDYVIDSVSLSQNGVPSIDPTNTGKLLIQKLSQ